MASYFLKIVFHDEPSELDLDLNALSHEEAEAYAADVRYQVTEAKNVNAPVIVVTSPKLDDLTLDPRRVVAVDLEENEAED